MAWMSQAQQRTFGTQWYNEDESIMLMVKLESVGNGILTISRISNLEFSSEDRDGY